MILLKMTDRCRCMNRKEITGWLSSVIMADRQEKADQDTTNTGDDAVAYTRNSSREERPAENDNCSVKVAGCVFEDRYFPSEEISIVESLQSNKTTLSSQKEMGAVVSSKNSKEVMMIADSYIGEMQKVPFN
eukprot:m.238830 g.238830  ORF g.238830 m.238830 type:complete len:132 (+) comp40173_c0_seq18:301-696(+)